ncbi:hypothetical protein LXN10_00820 [Arcobacter sp. KX21116]|uniref:hypothetical protein n=1 Tax=Arcobacter iocasae TaxID=2906515 RepID=UPI0035D3F8A7
MARIRRIVDTIYTIQTAWIRNNSFCLVTNHMHLIVIPKNVESLSKAIENSEEFTFTLDNTY